MALKITKRFTDTVNYQGQEVTIEVVREEGKVRREGKWKMVKYTLGYCSMFPEVEWSTNGINYGDVYVDSRRIDFIDMDFLVSSAIDDFIGKTTGAYEETKRDILSTPKVMIETRKLANKKISDIIVGSKKLKEDQITRKQKEKLNLLNDIVNFAYEYGENETKTLFKQAFKRVTGDDLADSLTDNE